MKEKKLGNLIKEKRIHKKITQEELAKKIGVSTGCISFYENSKCKPSFKTMMKLVELLNINLKNVKK